MQSDGITALHCAGEGGDVECVRLLQDRGADANVVSVSTGWLFARILWRGLCAVCGRRFWMFVCEVGCVKGTGCVFEDVAVACWYC